MANLLGKENMIVLIPDWIKKTESNLANIETLDKKLKDVNENNFILVHAVDDLEKTSKYLEKQIDNFLSQSPNYICNICSQPFKSEILLSEHVRVYHGPFRTKQRP